MDLFNKYVSMVEEIYTSIYADMIKFYPNIKAVKKELFNISQAALKNFGAIDPFEDKIDELIFLYNNIENKEKKIAIKNKLEILNNALKIINEDGTEDNEQ